MSRFECQVFFNSHEQDAPAAGAVDVAADPGAAHRLLQLGVSPRHDLPAVLLVEPGGKLRILGLRLSSEEVARLCAAEGLPAERLKVYSSAWCPDCRRAKRVLDEAAADFEEVDIDRDATAEATVLARSGGRRVVPTLLFDDRVWAFNPDPPLLRRLLSGRPAARL